MKGIFYILRLFLLFPFAFALSRCIFIIYFFPRFSHESFISILLSFYYALKTDVSAACYLLALPVLIVLAETVFDLKWAYALRRAYVLTVLFLNALITSADPGLYREWGVKMNYRALLYLRQPSEVVSTATVSQIFLFILISALQLAITWYAYRLFIKPTDHHFEANKRGVFLSSFILILLMALGMRGGINEIPLQSSDSYYSTNDALNCAAVNSLWVLGQSIIAGRRYGSGNPYQFFAKDDAQKVVNDLYATRADSGICFLKNKRPNVVLIIFEGWSADLVSSISGNKERACSPNFDRLAAGGILFTQCLASGERSDQGVTAVLSSFPSLPLSSVVNYPEKVAQLPALLAPFKQQAYHSFFLFGGQLAYGNLKSLIYHNGFEKVIEEKDIDPAIYRGRLGVHDEHTFDILYRELNAMRPPFMAGFFTQSTHFNYDYPKAKKPIAWAGGESDYANSLLYADSCLGDFFDKAKKEPWFASTLFILVSDHSHVLPWNSDHRRAALHHIPLLFCGDVIKEAYRGMKKEGVVSQQDVAATLLAQLGMAHDNFKWSTDLMDPDTKSFAYWTFTDGFGFTCSRDCEFVYDLADKKTLSKPSDHCYTTIERQGFSYLQMVFDDFISNGNKSNIQGHR